jgi:hypothetical protein
VFDILAADGKRLRGGIRAIQLTDLANGQSVRLATVKASAPGELMPPNQVVYRNAFDGLKADVMLVWKHNAFSQDVVIREQPTLPPGMSADTTYFEIVSEMVEFPTPTIREQSVPLTDSRRITDHVVIHFGRLAMIMGQAFPMTEDRA